MIWQYGEMELITFLEVFNIMHPSISLSHSYPMQSINFLDVTVTISQGRLQTTLYTKPTDISQYLHFHSSHVRHCKTQYLIYKLTVLGKSALAKLIPIPTAVNLKLLSLIKSTQSR